MFCFFILGREPQLSTAEIQAVYGSRIKNFPVTTNSILIAEMESFDAREAAARLGGSVKYGTIQPFETKTREEMVTRIANVVVEDCHKKRESAPVVRDQAPSKKITFAVDGYHNIDGKKLGFEVKGLLSREGHSVRMASSKEPQMSSAAVVQARLLDKGTNVVVVKDGATTLWVGVTAAVQPYEDQSKRDYERPSRDAKRGMIPVQLARILVNLAIGNGSSLLDPFCGIGTILMEAILVGIPKVVGADIDGNAIRDTKNNLTWAMKTFGLTAPMPVLATRDARQTPSTPQFDAIVTEPFLGEPVKNTLTQTAIGKRWDELAPLYRESLAALAKALAPGGTLVMTLPAYKLNAKFLPFPKQNLIPSSLTQKDAEPVIYKRADQFVGREILILKKT